MRVIQLYHIIECMKEKKKVGFIQLYHIIECMKEEKKVGFIQLQHIHIIPYIIFILSVVNQERVESGETNELQYKFYQ